MDLSKLKQLLDGYEWNDVEFKEAQIAVPKNAYESVSAFSNTAGGYLVFGVKQAGSGFEVVGVTNIDKVQNDFLTVLNGDQVFNRVISVKEHLFDVEGKAVLVFHIPEAKRQDKPIFMNGSTKRTYVRRGGCDEKCNEEDFRRLIRDASEERHDGETVGLNPEHFFNKETVKWYRTVFNKKETGRESLTDVEFLHDCGLIVEHGNSLVPTKAAVLLFGTGAAIRQVLPRPVVDIQRIETDWEGELLDERWADRKTVEENLIQTWLIVFEKFRSYAETPFEVDLVSLQRNTDPPDYIVFRESAINLLMHQDYSDHSRVGWIKFYRDRTVVWNPGDAFASTTEQLLEPGQKPVRNPRIVGAFRRIGLSEQAGSGIRAIYQNWQQLGHVPPLITNEKASKFFEMALPKEPLLSEEQILFQANLGVNLNEVEAKSFAICCRNGNLRIREVRAAFGLSIKDAVSIVKRLILQGIVVPAKTGDLSQVLIAEHLRDAIDPESLVSDQVDEIPGSLVTDQVDAKSPSLVSDQGETPVAAVEQSLGGALTSLTEVQWSIVNLCDVPRSLKDLMTELDVSHRTFFKNTHVDPLVEGGVLKLSHPESPRHPKQAYGLTPAGVQLRINHAEQTKEKD